MNELSTEVKARETHERALSNFSIAEHYGYKFLMDVKKIRDEKLYLHLGFLDFGEYCKSNWNYERDYMNERIRVANEFGEEYDGVHRSFGHTKSLLLSRMDESQREQVLDEGIPTKQGYKPYEEATQKEINEYKRNADEAEKRAKQAESQAETERKERERLERENEELANVEPERIEVVPDDYDFYKGNYESAVSLQKRYKKQMEEMREELNKTNVKGSDEEKKLKEREKSLKNKIKSIEKINDVQMHLDVVISQISTKTHSLDVDELFNDYQILDDFESTINEVINVCNDLKNKLPNKNIIEGEIVNE